MTVAARRIVDVVGQPAEMKVWALAPWAGAKRNLASAIVALLGRHDAYWEPFAGSMAILLAKKPSRIEVVNDLHCDLINMARVIQDPVLGPKLYRRLRRTLFSQDFHREAQEQLKRETDPLERAYCYFVTAWQSWGGVAGSKRAGNKMSIRYTNNGGHQAKRFVSAVESIPAWRRRLRDVTILNMDAFELIPKIDDAPGVVVYCDPVYIENAVAYEHDFLPIDHVRLAQALHRFKRARIIVSYYDHPALADLYPNWSQRKIEVTKSLARICKRESYRQRAVEVLLVNQRTAEGLFGVD